MSSLVFPSPTSPSWGIGWPVKKSPAYATIVQSPASGRGELRLPLQQWPRWRFELDITYAKGDLQAPNSWLQQIAGFFLAVQGRANDWLYDDPFDNFAPENAFGTGDGATAEFQLQRTLPSGGLDVIQNLNGAPSVWVAGTLTTPASISPTGLVTFTTAPPAGAALTWSGGFYFRCRFDSDSLPMQEDLYQVWSISPLTFTSVIL